MQLIELTLGAESKKPGAQQYTSETKSAFVKVAVHPGDKLEDVLAHARDVLAQALQDAAPARSVAAPPPAAPAGWRITVHGAKPMNTALRSLRLGWKDDHHELTTPNEQEARKVARAASLSGTDLKVRLYDPDGREVAVEGSA